MLEIKRLKEMLEEAGIPFEYTEDLQSERYHLCYPVNLIGERVCSVIQSEYSYGGKDNLLEIMGLLTDAEREKDDVVGWLTAEEVFSRIWKHWEAHHEKD